MKKLVLITAIISLASMSLFAAPGKGSEAYNSEIYWKAKSKFSDADFKLSLLLFNYLLELDPDNTELNAYVGLCYKNLCKEKIAQFYLCKVANDPAMMIRLKIEDMRTSHFSSVN